MERVDLDDRLRGTCEVRDRPAGPERPVSRYPGPANCAARTAGRQGRAATDLTRSLRLDDHPVPGGVQALPIVSAESPTMRSTDDFVSFDRAER